MKNKTLILGPGEKSHAGITAVIKAHKQSAFWKEYNCKWIGTHIDRNALWKIWIFITGLLRFIINLPGTRIVHIHFSDPTSAFRKSFFFKIAKFFKIKVIVHLHSPAAMNALIGPLGSRRRLYLNMLEGADAIVVLSGHWKSQIAGVISNPVKIHIVYNPCISNNRLSNINRQNQILFAGNLNRLKGYADLIYAFAKIARKHHDWKLVFAGNGEIENGRVIAKEVDIENQVVFRGWVSGREKEELFSSASIFCLPSYTEGFPMAILDAWAFGLPVIATPVGGLPDVLIHEENALVCNPGDIECLATSIAELITNEKLRIKLSRASIGLKEDQFSISTITGQLSEIYASLDT